jgi:glucose/mannose transport system substrate-binding protein
MKKFVFTLFSLLVVVSMLAACAPAATATTAPPVAPAATAAPAAGNKVEVFSWWVGPGEADGLAAMIKIFAAQYPNDTFVNASVAGGAGTNAKAVLATRLSAGDPPDSWQAHAGEATFTYVDAKQIQPLDDFFKSSGFGAALPAALLPLISKDGHPYSVPVNIHRSNVMWYNPKVLAAAKVTVPAGGFANYADFFAACDKIKAAGKTCLALGPAWTTVHLFENVVIGTIGADGWAGLWTGKTDWASPDVTKALNNYAKALTYTNNDSRFLVARRHTYAF